MIIALQDAKPRWQPDGDDWLMIVGNRTVAALIWNPNDRLFPHLTWLSRILCDKPDDFGWDAVDYASLPCAQYNLEQWWRYAMRGQRYDAGLHCNCPHCGFRSGANCDA
jgi:hypothetical protein